MRYSEHFRDYKYNNKKPKFAQHLLDDNHSFGPMTTGTDTLYSTAKGRILDTVEK
jgi:hypothetical protein